MMGQTTTSGTFACLILSAAGLFLSAAAADISPKGVWINLRQDDPRGQAIARILYADDLAEARRYANEGRPVEIFTAWAKVAPSDEPYLFIKLTGPFCGNVNCGLDGYRNTPNGWQAVFQGNGTGWKVLSASHGGRRDLWETRHDSASYSEDVTFRWSAGRYHPVFRRRVCHPTFNNDTRQLENDCPSAAPAG